MSILHIVSREFVLGGHLLALGTSSIAAAAAILEGKEPTPSLLIMAYLFSYGAYMLNRSSELEQDALSHPSRTEYLIRRKRYFPFVVGFCFVVGYVLAILTNLIFFAALLAPFVLAVAYSVGSKRLVKVLGTKKLKEKFILKNIVISFSWSLIPLFVGLYYLSIPIAVLIFCPFIFFRLMVNTVLFDIRDVKADDAFGVKTMPTVLGVGKSLKTIQMFDLLSIIYLAIIIGLNLLPLYGLILLLLPAYSVFYRWLGRRPNWTIDTICDIFADGEYLLWGPLIVIGELFSTYSAFII